MSAPDTVAAAGDPGRRRRLVIALVMLTGGGVVWGVTFSLAKLVTGTGIDPIGLALLTGAVGALILLPYALSRPGGIPLRRAYLETYVVAGSLGTAIPSCVLFAAASRMPAGILAIIVSLMPLMTYGLALSLRIERFRARRAAGIGIGLVAVLMIVLPDAGLPERAMVGWVLFALITPLAYAGENVYIAIRRPADSNPYALLCGMLTAASLILLPVVLVSGRWVPLESLDAEIMLLILALSLVNIVGYVTFLELIRNAGVLFAALMGYVVTVSGVLWGVAIFGETHSIWIWGALALLFVGVALVNPRRG